MAKIDEIKEEITLFRSLLITFIVLLASLAAWIMQHKTSQDLVFAIVAMIGLIGAILVLLKITIKKIRSLKDL